MKLKNKTLLLSAVILFVVSMSGCAPSLKVSSDFDRSADFSGYKTFGVFNLKSIGSVSELNAGRIVNAINMQMEAKGYRPVASNPDLMINAVTILKEKQQVSSTTNYYGYGGMYRPYGYWGAPMTGYTSVNTYTYKDGSLVIDVVDAKTNKMIWQGTGNSTIDKAPKNPDELIQSAVKKIMEDYPKAK